MKVVSLSRSCSREISLPFSFLKVSSSFSPVCFFYLFLLSVSFICFFLPFPLFGLFSYSLIDYIFSWFPLLAFPSPISFIAYHIYLVLAVFSSLCNLCIILSLPLPFSPLIFTLSPPPLPF